MVTLVVPGFQNAYFVQVFMAIRPTDMYSLRWVEKEKEEKTHSFQMRQSKLTVPSLIATCQPPPAAVRVATALTTIVTAGG